LEEEEAVEEEEEVVVLAVIWLALIRIKEQVLIQ
jgi:hypothetical protein|tara:strand:- start:648 stop:749 length:102 start_codon:yes stop_codon:yes gene_type:complete